MLRRMMRVLAAVLLVISVVLSAAAESGMTVIELKDGGIAGNDSHVKVDGKAVVIYEPGEYLISGTLDDGMLKVDCEEEGKVIIHLNNVTIRNENGPALYVVNGDPRTVVSLADGSDNILSSGKHLEYENDDEPNGTIFSKCDLTINGSGILRVTAEEMDGIVSKDDLKIEGGELYVDAARHGIRGKDAVEIQGGVIDIKAGKDGIKSTNEKQPEWGYVLITGGQIHIVCGDDPIQFVTSCKQENAQISAEMLK